jgi:DnaJ-class molecular chaperone
MQIPGTWYQPIVPPTPTYTIQQCPRCEGQGVFVVYGEDDDGVDCPFCWGVGVVKVRWFSGEVETVDPPPEPNWHEQKRLAKRMQAERADGGQGQ